ncbi:malto-oligosyltrehalose trehalohydrolase [Ancylobacter radicis]|uniref:Malto-oligosyltrehalose trehalohydrolase n=1 Tax=Ancylobacter radicis TaxID=2836179 RepID=A0ABS5R5N5_9HYPH|nr:malto-oligosyltrehalose trehalohydrolase [Ancylobacter radicis]MBS9476991.1 malto-oligosyltrehalose trehalohydrolase [Ancylobacter radicis]
MSDNPRRFGPELTASGARFRLFAPDVPAVELEIEGRVPVPLTRTEDGFFAGEVDGLAPGARYRFKVGDQPVPDPASRMQAEDADGWSVLVAPPDALPRAWSRPWHEAVIAEVHVGTATPDGTFLGLIERLDHYRDAGFTVIELMPVNEFPGRRNWGYDGVLLYAPDRAYGTPEELRALIDAAHARGLGVMLDVVYNHFGPSGNYLPLYAKSFFRQDISTPWGPAIDLENPLVRAFFTENAAYWLSDFGFDGLRFDAVHALATDGAETFLRELAGACRAVRPDAFLVLENHDNIAEWLTRDDRLYTAQWNDDWHHALHVLGSGETTGYYAPYATDATEAAARALGQGFVYQGDPYPYADGPPRGTPSDHLPPDAFVSFVQNHDHIGNRPLGDRLAGTLAAERLAVLRFVLMLSPEIPLLFQGEEALLPTPFPFFCDFEGELADAVRNGRKAEFGDFFSAHGEAEFPDPLAESTFRSAIITDAALASEDAQEALAAFAELAETRRRLVWPIAGTRYEGSQVKRSGDALLAHWRYEAGELVLALNLQDSRSTIHAPSETPDARVGSMAQPAPGRLALGPVAAAFWSLPA